MFAARWSLSRAMFAARTSRITIINLKKRAEREVTLLVTSLKAATRTSLASLSDVRLAELLLIWCPPNTVLKLMYILRGVDITYEDKALTG